MYGLFFFLEGFLPFKINLRIRKVEISFQYLTPTEKANL